MGSCLTKEVPGDDQQAKQKANAAAAAPGSGGIQNYAGVRPKLDPKDFEFVGLRGQTCVKPPGSINGQAFNIDKCEDCDLYILDTCDQVIIDDCRNCRIFVGPTESSIFIRGSVRCKCAFICRQLRTRDCVDVQISLFCRTRPIIESSAEMGFACYDWNYPQLAGQLQSVKLSPLVNFWSHVYDFTPASASIGEPNFRLLPPATSALSLLGDLPPTVAEAVAGGSNKQVLFKTYGSRAPPLSGYLFVLFPPKSAGAALGFAETVANSEATLLFCNTAAVLADNVSSLVENAGWAPGTEKHLVPGVSTGFEFAGTVDVLAAVQAAAQERGALCTAARIGEGFRYLGLD